MKELGTMRHRKLLALGCTALVGGTAWAQSPIPAAPPATKPVPVIVAQADDAPAAPGDVPAVASPTFGEGESAGEAAEESGGYGPYPIQKMVYLQNLLRAACGKSPLDKDLKPCDGGPGDCGKKDPCLRIFGWMDFDYTYRSTGGGNNPIAPVMNHYGNEFLNRQNGIAVSKVLDPKEWSWGFNMILIAGSDASFLNPTQGWFTGDYGPGGSNRYSIQFTDLNMTAHLPILTDGGVDIKAGRQTTILGPMGALPWQRWFDSSDYAWYNMEEGRYTGVSSVWHITPRLDWYNGFELGWGTFYAQIDKCVDYITNISYWLDEKKEKTRIWTTVLTGPTSKHSGKFTTVLELGAQHNYGKYWYQILDTQMVWSRGPVNAEVPPDYNQRAYDVYTYVGTHLSKCLDLNSRFEWYKDVDGNSYAGGFGVPHNTYFETTLGIDYHPRNWIQFRPEIRYDAADHPNFGENFDKKNQLSIAADVLLKF
jgi:hypothetical protein